MDGVERGVDLLGFGVLVGALVLATAVGLVLRSRAGQVRTARTDGSTAGDGPAGIHAWAMAGVVPAADDRVLLLQLSSPVCAPCRQTAALLTELTSRTPGIVHAEIDVADRLDVARALHVLRTPTVVAFDRSGLELLRVSGVPRVADLEAALASARTARPIGDGRRGSRLSSTP